MSQTDQVSAKKATKSSVKVTVFWPLLTILTPLRTFDIDTRPKKREKIRVKTIHRITLEECNVGHFSKVSRVKTETTTSLLGIVDSIFVYNFFKKMCVFPDFYLIFPLQNRPYLKIPPTLFLVCPEVYECIQPYRTSQHTSFWYADHSYRCDSITKLYSCLERNIPKRCFTKDLYVSLLREKYQLREILTNICKRRRE